MSTSGLNPKSEVNAAGESNLNPGCWVTCSSGGYAEIHWTAAKTSREFRLGCTLQRCQQNK